MIQPSLALSSSVSSPLVSIITPTYNSGLYIEETIQSVLAQDYQPIEHIIMDGGSTDDTAERVARYPSVRYIREVDRGQTDAINKGFAASSGQYMSWLNADDLLLPGAVSTIVDGFARYPDASFIYGDYTLLDSRGNTILERRCIEFDRNVLLYGRALISQPASFVRRESWERLGPLDERYDFCMDIEYWTRAIMAREQFRSVRHPVAATRLHEETKTSTQRGKLARQHREILNAHHLLPFRAHNRLNERAYRTLLLYYKAVGAAKRLVTRGEFGPGAVTRARRRYRQESGA